MKKAKELDVKILNINIDEQIKKIEDFINSKKKEAKETKKEAKGEKQEQKSEEPKQDMTDGQKKEADKKEKDRVLTKKV